MYVVSLPATTVMMLLSCHSVTGVRLLGVSNEPPCPAVLSILDAIGKVFSAWLGDGWEYDPEVRL
jgi:hypothetical protein